MARMLNAGARIALLAVVAGPAVGQVKTLPVPVSPPIRVSVSSAGVQGNDTSQHPKLSPDGRFVGFTSDASNLVPGDTNGVADAFVRDRMLGTMTRVSVDSAGNQGNAISTTPSFSLDGRYATFLSSASNLVAGDTNMANDIFVHDLWTRTTERVSLDSAGVQGDYHSSNSSLSADGRHVVFVSSATNLVPFDDPYYQSDVFVRDRATGITTRVSVSSAGVKGNSGSTSARITPDGCTVAFMSLATNLVPQDTNGFPDVFVHDRVSGTTERVSVGSSGAEGNARSLYPSLSSDSRYVAFSSHASNLVAQDTNGSVDIFVRDRINGTTTRVSVSSGGAEGNGDSDTPSISSDGRFVAFASYASNLVPQDTNGTGDFFVHDRATVTTKRVSITSAGTQGAGDPYLDGIPVLSSRGHYVAFSSTADDLVPMDTNARVDVFVRRLR